MTKKPKAKADIPFGMREKIDIARIQRFPCENCVLTESAQYKVLYAEAVQRLAHYDIKFEDDQN